jgi:hypothetical protein
MRKKRDRYQSPLENFPTRGVTVASSDLSGILYLLFSWAEKQRMLDQQIQISIRHEESRTVHELLNIARHALEDSIDPALGVYRRLQQNEEAARLIVEADVLGNSWRHVSGALTNTLNNKAIVSRGFVSGARREIARREKQNGGDAA